MEATGIYWMALYDQLERQGLEVVRVEPRSVKQVPGRKSDVLDCQWLQKLHTYGLLSGSFRPVEAIRRRRTLTRHRLELVQDGARCLQHVEKALVQMNLQLHLVVSDIQGDTGMRILQAIINGQRDPKELVKLRDPRCQKSTVAQMQAGLHGHYREELLLVVGPGHSQPEIRRPKETRSPRSELIATPAEQPPIESGHSRNSELPPITQMGADNKAGRQAGRLRYGLFPICEYRRHLRLRHSDFGLLSGFGLRSSDFRAAEHDLPSTGRTLEQPWGVAKPGKFGLES